MTIRCLLVGVNDYLGVNKPLRGCVNDVALLKNRFQDRFGIPDDDIKTLLDQEATRENIIRGFEDHLIQPATKDDVIVFYFSGHGAQTRTIPEFYPFEPDRKEESLVCYDSRHNGTADLRDKELRYLIAAAADRCEHVLIILDCCHGGHGTRFIEDESRVRLAETGIKANSIKDYYLHEAMLEDLLKHNKLREGKHVLLSACEDFETAKEDMQIDGGIHGFFTYALAEILSGTEQAISYQECVERCRAQILRKGVYAQNPQLETIEGDNNSHTQAILGGKILPLKFLVHYLPGTQQHSEGWHLNAGSIHGFNEGDEFSLFGINEKIENISETVTSTATIDKLGSKDSVLRVKNDTNLIVQESYQAIVTKRNFTKIGVKIEGDKDHTESLVKLLSGDPSRALVDGLQPSQFLRLDDLTPSYNIKANARGFTIHTADPNDQRPLFKLQKNAEACLSDLANMARFWQKHGLNNPTSKIKSDDIELVVHYEEESYVNRDVTVSYKEIDGHWIQPKISMEIRLGPNVPRDRTYYCGLLFMDGSLGSITDRLLPVSVQRLSSSLDQHNTELNLVDSIQVSGGKEIPLKIPTTLLKQGVTQVQDYLKLIVCEDYSFDITLMNQEGLDLYDPQAKGLSNNTRSLRGLHTTLNQFMQNVHTRSWGADEPEEDSDWMSKTYSLTIQRPNEWQTIDGQSNGEFSVATNNIRWHTDANISGKIRLVSSVQENAKKDRSATTSTSDFNTSMFVDPVLGDDITSETFTFSDGSRSDLGLDTLEIELQGDTNTLSPEKPLVIEFPGHFEENEALLPLAYHSNGDDSWLLPVGFSREVDGNIQVIIEHSPFGGDTANNRDRGFFSSIKVYFQKLTYKHIFKTEIDQHTLGMPEFSNSEAPELINSITEQSSISKKIAPASSILIFIHGIIGDTKTSVNLVNTQHPELGALVNHYDAILTFDYENLNTPIQDTALIFKEKLAGVGISSGCGKKVDIVAHSMGGLVSRWMIEHLQGDEFIDTLVMAGTPNGGSPLGKLVSGGVMGIHGWSYSILTTVINGLTPQPISGVVINGLLKLMEKTSGKVLDGAMISLQQMNEDSDIISALKQNSPPDCQYIVFAGDTSKLPLAEDRARLRSYLSSRLKLSGYELLTHRVFDEPNDIATSVSSVKQFNQSWKDEVIVNEVGTDHFGYFDATGLKVISGLLLKVGD